MPCEIVRIRFLISLLRAFFDLDLLLLMCCYSTIPIPIIQVLFLSLFLHESASDPFVLPFKGMKNVYRSITAGNVSVLALYLY